MSALGGLATWALAAAVGFLALRYLVLATDGFTSTPVLFRTNHRGDEVPASGGILVVFAVLLVEAGRSMLGALGVGGDPGENVARTLVLFACLAFGFLGFVDDVLGDAGDRGFRGHIRALAEGRMTTGLLKLLGGAAAALILVAVPDFVSGKRLIADAVLIALAANLGNLFDRAPGRTIKVALVAYTPLALVAGSGPVGVAVAPVMGASLGILGDDLRERVMLGDAGANVIGAVLGLMVVLELGRGARTAVLVALLVLNVAAELVSFSDVIARTPFLRRFDEAGRTP
ncbi:MAG: hypothetical protein R3A49_03075 [Acidimicrobiia bacterium]